MSPFYSFSYNTSHIITLHMINYGAFPYIGIDVDLKQGKRSVAVKRVEKIFYSCMLSRQNIYLHQ